MTLYEVTKPHNLQPIRFWFGPLLLISLANPDHLEKIFSSQKFAAKPEIYDVVKEFLGEGLVTGSGTKYKQHRKMIQPMFDQNFVMECIGVIQKNIDLCMEKLEKFVDKETFDVDSIIHKCMIDIVKEIILGFQEKSQVNGLNEYDRAGIDVYDLIISRYAKPWLQVDVIFNMTSLKKKQDKLKELLKKYGKIAIEASRHRRKNKTRSEFYPIIDRIIDHIEDNQVAISDEVLTDHVHTLFAASEDTLAVEAGFLTLCLGMYPEYQKKAADEIRNIFGDTPRPTTFEDIKKLQYVPMCIKEVLRLFPIGPLILRKCSDNYQLGKWLIPKDCAIGVPIFTIHRDERYWENPNDFYPDHFLPEVADKRHTYAYLPFSAGIRGCIGKLLAHTGLKMFVCNLLQRFEIEAEGKVSDLKLRMDVSTRSKNGFNVRIKKRVWK